MSRLTLRARFALRVLAGALGAAGTGHAQSEPDLQTLLGESVVSTPSKSAEGETTAPATSSIITAEDLRRHGLRSLNEAINYLAMGMVATSPLHAVEVGARGVLLTSDYGSHVLLLVDGHALNEPWNGTAYFERGAGIPFELVDHIEVILGPGSVMYGSQAMLGVINIVTKRARDYAGLRVLAEGELSAPATQSGALRPLSSSGYGDALGAGSRVGLGFGRELELFDQRAELIAQLEYYRQRGPAFRFGPQAWGNDEVTGEPVDYGPRSEPGSWGGLAQRAYYTRVPTAYARFTLGDFQALARLGEYRRGTPYLDSIVSSAADFDDPENYERDRFANFELKQRLALSSKTELGLRLYADINEYKWYSTSSAAQDCPDGYAGCKRVLTGVGRTLGLEARSTIAWQRALRIATLLGVDTRLRDVASGFDLQDAPGTQSSNYGADRETNAHVALFAEQTASPTRWLDLNLGARWDYDPVYGSKLSPRAAAGAQAWQGGRFKTIYSEAFRGPSPYERNYSDPVDQIAAPDLGAETVRSVEASFEQRFSGQRLFFGVFRSWWHDMVGDALVDGDAVDAAVAQGTLLPGTLEAFQYQNIAGIDSYGLNAAFEGQAAGNRLHYGLSLTEAFTRYDAGEGPEPPTVGPTTFGNARVAYDLPSGFPTLGLALFYHASALADRSLDGDFAVLPVAPANLQLRGTLSGAVPRLRGMSYRFSLAYAAARKGPYVIGPTQYATDLVDRAELSPLERLQGFLGLEYVWDPR